MKPSTLRLLVVLNVVLLGAVYLTAGVAPRAEAQAAGGAAKYTMIASRTDGASNEATIYVVDLATSATVPLRYRENRQRFYLSRGRAISEDANAVVGDRPLGE